MNTKTILAIALLVAGIGFGATNAHAATVCTLYPGDPLLQGDNPVGGIMRHGDGSWQVECPQVTIKASLPDGAAYYLTADGNTVYSGTQPQTFTLPRVEDYSINVSNMPSGYTAQTSAGCAGTLTYGDRKECDLTFTAPAPQPVQSFAPSLGAATPVAPVESVQSAPEATTSPDTTVITQDVVVEGVQGTTTTTTTITTPRKATVPSTIDPAATTTVNVASEAAKDSEISSLKTEVGYLIKIILALLQQIAGLKAPTP